MFRLKIIQFSNSLFRLSIAAIFAYFGFLAASDPVLQTQIWINTDVYGIIINFVEVELFIRIFGIAQIALALLIFSGRFLKFTLPVAAAMLVGIIFNLGLNEVAYRDAVILAGVIYLWSQEL